jgi:hypothetical protein
MKRLALVAPLLLALLACSKNPATVASADGSEAAPPAPAPAKPEVAPVTLPAGTAVRVRLSETLDTVRNRAGDRFEATLSSPVEVNGTVVIPKDTKFSGHVASSESSGRLEGRAHLAVELDSFTLNGATYNIRAAAIGRSSTAHKKRNAALIGGGSGVGAIIGGIAGGGKGALVGAAAGAAAGTAGAAATGKKQVQIPVETVLIFRLTAPVSVKTAS